MKHLRILPLSVLLALFGCTAANTQGETAANASYEEYCKTIERLDALKSYHVSTSSYDHAYAEDYEYLEESQSKITVGTDSDTAVETTTIYFVYDDGTKEDVTCNATELAQAEPSEGCQMVHTFQEGSVTYSDGYAADAKKRMSQQYFMIMENMEDAVYVKEGNEWTISGTSDAGNDYTATLRVDESGMPQTFTYVYEGLGISMTRTVSDIQE